MGVKRKLHTSLHEDRIGVQKRRWSLSCSVILTLRTVTASLLTLALNSASEKAAPQNQGPRTSFYLQSRPPLPSPHPPAPRPLHPFLSPRRTSNYFNSSCPATQSHRVRGQRARSHRPRQRIDFEHAIESEAHVARGPPNQWHAYDGHSI